MKFTINKSVLLDALVLTGKGVSQKPIIPIYGDYLFRIVEDTLTITGGSEGFHVSKDLVIQGGGFIKSLAIPATKLQNIVRAIPDQPIHISIIETKGEKVTTINVKIKSSTGTYTLPAENGDDYPHLENSGTNAFELELQPLLSCLNKTIFACSTDELRPALTGVNISFAGDKAIFVGASRGGMSISSLPVAFQSDKNIIVPTKILTVLQQVASGDKIKVRIGENNIHFIDESGVQLKSVLVAEKYLDYKAVVPVKHTKHIIVNVPEFVGAIKRVSMFAEIGSDVFKIEFSEKKCVLTARNDLGEDAKEEISVQYDGVPIAFGASGKQFSASLSKMENEETNILLTEPGRGIVLADEPETVPSIRDFVMVMPYAIPQGL